MTRDDVILKLFLNKTQHAIIHSDKFGKPSLASARELVKNVWPACEVLADALLEEGKLHVDGPRADF